MHDIAIVACAILLLLHAWYCCCYMYNIAAVACMILLLLHVWYCCCCMRDIAAVACMILLLLHAWYCSCCIHDIAAVAWVILLLLHAWYCLHDCMCVTGIVAAGAYLCIFWYYSCCKVSMFGYIVWCSYQVWTVLHHPSGFKHTNSIKAAKTNHSSLWQLPILSHHAVISLDLTNMHTHDLIAFCTVSFSKSTTHPCIA